MSAAHSRGMVILEKTRQARLEPWQKGPLRPEQVATYRKSSVLPPSTLPAAHMISTLPNGKITPWAKAAMVPEQAENYRQAIAPMQQTLAAAKNARLQVFKSLKG
jgi:hypothetical protein